MTKPLNALIVLLIYFAWKSRLVTVSSRSVGWEASLLVLPVMYLVYLFYRFYLQHVTLEPQIAVKATA